MVSHPIPSPCTQVVAQERQRLAYRLHDTFNQSLFSASTTAGALVKLIDTNPDLARHYVYELHEMLRDASAELHSLLDELNEAAGD